MSAAFRVSKFGGASLRDGPAVRRAVEVLLEHGGERPLAVVSAHHGVTALLRAAAADAGRGQLSWDEIRIRHRTLLRQLDLEGDLLDRHLYELRAVLDEFRRRGAVDRRGRDFVLSFGERMSARVIAAVLRRSGAAATPVDAYDLGLISEGTPDGRARLLPGAERVRATLEGVPGIPVVTGFLALDAAGHLTTLGRNGSDLSAAWLAESLGADEVVLWKAVDGVSTADPELVPDARRLDALSWSEAAELAAHGSEVLHAGALEPARRGGVRIRVRSVRAPAEPGTVVAGEAVRRGPLAIAHRRRVALVVQKLDLGREHGPQLVELIAHLADAGVEPWLCSMTGTEAGLLVPDAPELVSIVGALSPGAEIEHGLASLSIVGGDVGRDQDLADEVERVARSVGTAIRPAPVGESPLARVFLVSDESLPAVLVAVHARLFGGAGVQRPEPRGIGAPR